MNHLPPVENGVVTKTRIQKYPWYERIDPLYEIHFKDSITMRWDRITTTQYMILPDDQGILRHRANNFFSPIKESASFLYSQTSIKTMSVLFQYHQLSTLQIASLLGISRQSLWNHILRLYRAGILNRSIPNWWSENNDEDEVGGSGSIWSIYYSGWPYESWANDLDPIEWALIVSGDDKSPSNQTPTTIRHNMVTAETIIKAMEVCPGVIGGWGDRISGEGRFYSYTDNDRESGNSRGNVGDGVIITNSGKAIILETTGAARMEQSRHGKRISDKAASWVAILANTDLDACVVFMNSNQNARIGALEKYVRQGVETSSLIVSTKLREIGQKRVFVANGYDWFPAPRTIDESFVEMEAFSPFMERNVKLAPADEPLETTDLVKNTIMSLHTPDWIRDPIV